MTEAAACVMAMSDEADRQLELRHGESGITSLLSDHQARLVAGIELPRAREGCLTAVRVRILLRLRGSGPSDPSRLIPDEED